MNCENAYYHMVSQISNLINLIEDGQADKGQIDVCSLLKAIQAESEEICAGDIRLSFKAPRHN